MQISIKREAWAILFCCILAITSEGFGYQEIHVSNGGTITGTVVLNGSVPKPKGYNLTTLPDQFYCGRISDGQGWRILQPFEVGPHRELQNVVMYLEDIEKGKAFGESDGVTIEARDCLFVPFITVVRDNQMVTVVNMDPVMHDIQAYETSQLGARVVFNVPLPMNPQHPRNFKDRTDAGLYHKHMAGQPVKQRINLTKGRNVFVMQCGFHAYMESWALAVTNPYYAKTDEAGRFTISDVPPGTYKLVAWHPYVRQRFEQTVIVRAGETVHTPVSIEAPTGRLYANEVLDHDYVRYKVTEDVKREIEPVLERQEHH